MERLLIVSGDSHGAPSPDMWEELVEPRFHEYLPQLRRENESYVAVTKVLSDLSPEMRSVLDVEGAIATGGINGLWDRDRRLAEMDREGIAAELVFSGDPTVIAMFFHPTNNPYPPDVRAAGARAWNRWAQACLKDDDGRILPIGTAGYIPDIDEAVEELHWIADHGFVGTVCPGSTGEVGVPPLFDRVYDQFWAACQQLDLKLFIHAGYGEHQGEVTAILERLTSRMGAGPEVLREIMSKTDNSLFFGDLRPRQALMSLLLGGVFDRFPELRLAITECRGDWIPDTIARLDVHCERGSYPTERRPSEYWKSNCRAVLSFIHRSEVEMRDQIGVDSMIFGRDYPHAEGTWPNTVSYLQAAMAGVPATEVRSMLGGCAIEFLGLDRQHLRETADRIGRRLDEVMTPTRPLDPRLVEAFQDRSGFLKPREDVNLDNIDDWVTNEMSGLAD